MTALDEWDQPSPVDDFRRDQWDRPLILQPDGTRIGYTRSSTAAKTIEDTYNLQQWALRNVAYGMAYDASLVARLIALGGNPAIWDKATKQAVQKVCGDAEGIAQAHKGADIGSAVHHLTHRLDRGEDVDAGPYQPDLTAYRKATLAHGLFACPEYIEVRIVNDLLRMAGSADRIVWDQATSSYRIADIKTGQTVDFGGLGWAAQLAAYAGGVLYDVAHETRIATPPVDQQVGYIIHLPAGQGRCDIYEVDLVAGHRAAELANEIRAVRKASKQWITPKSTWCAAPPAEGQPGEEGPANSPSPTIVAPGSSPVERQAGAVDATAPADIAAAPVVPLLGAPPDPPPNPSAGAGGGSTIDQQTQAEEPPTGETQDHLTGERGAGEGDDTASTVTLSTPPPTIAVPGDAVSATRRRELLERYHALGELDRKRFDAHFDRNATGGDLEEVEAALKKIEATAARSNVTPTPPAAPPSPPTPDEGDDVSTLGHIMAVKSAYNRLPADARQWVDSLVHEGKEAGVPWHTGGLHSVRRYELGRAVVALAGTFTYLDVGMDMEHGIHDDVIRGLLGEATGREEVEQDSLPLGAAIGTLNADEATRFAVLVDEYLSPGSAA